MRASYPVKRLTGETLALLMSATPIIVRMETLRRAALYATGYRRSHERCLPPPGSREGEGAERLASFDAGYLAETFKQVEPFSPGTAALARASTAMRWWRRASRTVPTRRSSSRPR